VRLLLPKSAILSFVCVLLLALLGPAHAVAHPVGERNYDRSLRIGLTAEALYIDYDLEINTATVLRDLASAADDDLDLTKLTAPSDFYEAFIRVHAPILARNLDAKFDGKALTFECVKKSYEVRDKTSLHCSFRFRAPWRPVSGSPHELTFYEGNYELEAGIVRMAVVWSEAISTDTVDVPSDALQNKAPTQLKPGEEKKLRQATVTFTTKGVEPAYTPPVEHNTPPNEPTPPATPTPSVWDARSLDDLVKYRNEPLWLLLPLALILGAGHALTPGHGKTLAAAYLVGERGTVWHALYLGLTTTLSHTGIVLTVAVIVANFFGGKTPPGLQYWIGLAGGLSVAGMGAFLLLARLSGRADHVHLGGGHGHGHGHGHGDDEGHSHGGIAHYHDEHGRPVMNGTFGWWRLTVLGLIGGMVPCWDAIALYVSLAALGLLVQAVPILLAFSAGLAAVLVVVGVLVVKAKGLSGQSWGDSRAFKLLPIFSAVAVTLLGLWLCYRTLNGQG
jgi:nickel/cobalt exporter